MHRSAPRPEITYANGKLTVPSQFGTLCTFTLYGGQFVFDRKGPLESLRGQSLQAKDPLSGELVDFDPLFILNITRVGRNLKWQAQLELHPTWCAVDMITVKSGGYVLPDQLISAMRRMVSHRGSIKSRLSELAT